MGIKSTIKANLKSLKNQFMHNKNKNDEKTSVKDFSLDDNEIENYKKLHGVEAPAHLGEYLESIPGASSYNYNDTTYLPPSYLYKSKPYYEKPIIRIDSASEEEYDSSMEDYLSSTINDSDASFNLSDSENDMIISNCNYTTTLPTESYITKFLEDDLNTQGSYNLVVQNLVEAVLIEIASLYEFIQYLKQGLKSEEYSHYSIKDLRILLDDYLSSFTEGELKLFKTNTKHLDTTSCYLPKASYLDEILNSLLTELNQNETKQPDKNELEELLSSSNLLEISELFDEIELVTTIPEDDYIA